jgi:hypothetical protein
MSESSKRIAQMLIGDGSRIFVHDGNGRGCWITEEELAALIDREMSRLPSTERFVIEF